MVELPSPLDDSVKIQMLALKLPRWCLPYWSCFALISACYPPFLPIKLEMFTLYQCIVEVCDLFYFFGGWGDTQDPASSRFFMVVCFWKSPWASWLWNLLLQVCMHETQSWDCGSFCLSFFFDNWEIQKLVLYMFLLKDTLSDNNQAIVQTLVSSRESLSDLH